VLCVIAASLEALAFSSTAPTWAEARLLPGLGGEVLRALGVAVVNLPTGEIFPALQSGTIDGTEWVGPWHDLAFGFHKVVKNYHYPGFHEPGTMGSYAVNRKFWDSLSKEDQLIIAMVLEAECFIQTAEYDGASPGALEKLFRSTVLRQPIALMQPTPLA
jgi:TRAP-type mannitol/chloroaromatic compound transport system substrate-binding protein